MIPQEFVEFSEGFEVGFLAWLKDNRPHMETVDFIISPDRIVVEFTEYNPLCIPGFGEHVTLTFTNPSYTELCEMGMIRGQLKKQGAELEIEPHDITWTLSFNVNSYPDRLVKRWKNG